MSTTHKALKRIVAIVATFAMALALVPSLALAADPTHTITITEPKGNVNEHTYEAYQVFAGTYVAAADGKPAQLQNITWGAGVDKTKILQALKDDATVGTKFANATDAATAAAAMKDMTAAEVDAMAKVIAKNLSETVAATGKSPLSVTGDGYYFVKDVSTGLTSDTYSKYILQVCNDVSITAKDTTTTSKKEVKDTNDSTANSTSDWQNTADYDIGDAVPFKLTGTVASDYADYSAPYYFAFHDKYVKTELGDPQNVKVYIDGNEVTDKTLYSVTTPAERTDGTYGFDVVFSDLKKTNAVAKSVITVEYTSELLEGANIGSKGNVNTSNIEFSNNSNGEQHGTTPDDTVIVFTYKLDVNKYADSVADTNKLNGATFSLYKKIAADGTLPKGKTTADVVDGYVLIGKITGTDKSSFEWKGLDDGDYKLVEDTAPTGYNKIDPITFTVTSVKDDAGKTLTSINGITSTGEIDLGTQQKASVDTPNGTISTNVVDKSGSTLPSTGGMGIAPFLIIGCGIAALAGVGLHMTRAKREEA